MLYYFRERRGEAEAIRMMFKEAKIVRFLSRSVLFISVALWQSAAALPPSHTPSAAL